MNPKYKEKWINALESGAFEQNRTALRKDQHSFCALGLLIHVIDPHSWRNCQVHGPSFAYVYDAEDGTGPFALSFPRTIQQQAGLSDAELATVLDCDRRHKSFREIAAHVRKHL